MTIIEINARPDGGHELQSQSGRTMCWMDGWVEVPDNLEAQIWATVGYCDLQIENGKLVGITPTDRTEPELDSIKEERISQSKVDLETYLLEHPLLWTDGEYYAITQNKQNQLTSTLVSAQVDGEPPEWNSTGLVCKQWDAAELAALGCAIKNRVKALVKYQQAKELEIQAVESMEELDAIVVDYDSVE